MKNWKKIILGVVGIFVLLGVIGFIFGDATPQTSQNSPESAQNEPVQQPAGKELSETDKREIYKAFVAADDRARLEAEEQYPTETSYTDNMEENLNKKFELMDELYEKYRAEVRARYDLDEAIQKSILNEGTLSEWDLE